MMRKDFNRNEKNSVREFDSDRYNFDNLDLLNLRVSYSSDLTKRQYEQDHHTRPSLVAGGGDLHHSPKYFEKNTSCYPQCTGDYSSGYKHSKPYDQYINPYCHSRLESIGKKFYSRTPQSLQRIPDPPRSQSGPRESSKSNDKLSEVDTFRDKQRSDVNSVILLYSNKKRFSPQYPSKEDHSSAGEGNVVEKRKVIEEKKITKNKKHIEKKKDIEDNNLMIVGSRRNSESGINGGRFPFRVTPSGNFKIQSNQVVFESAKLSVLVADPEKTKVNFRGQRNLSTNFSDMQREGEGIRRVMMENMAPSSSIDQNFIMRKFAEHTPQRKEKEASEYEGKAINEILDPELNLSRLGYTTSDAIDWDEVELPEKKNLYLELYSRITNFTNADCKVYIDNEEFNCHLLVLQCYSEVFHTYVAVKKVELPSDKCTPSSFGFIYEWMITGDPSYKDLNRENVLDIFSAAKYLKIRDLIEQCWAFIDNPDVFSEDTAFLLYADAKEKNLPEVRELMLPRIQKFFLMLVSSQDWLELELDDVQNMLQSNYICVNCEMEVFMSAMRWLKHDNENRSKYKVPLLNCVRFGNIAPWQLVDIKRNLDNQDFKEAAMDPEICKMIDDGLAFVIIKYWYGQENEDYQHWNSILALKEPPHRNWSGMEKTYFTYREFLIYLDQYRRIQMIEKTKPKEKKKRLMEHRIHTDTLNSASLDRRSTTKIRNADEIMINRINKNKISPRKVLLEIDEITTKRIHSPEVRHVYEVHHMTKRTRRGTRTIRMSNNEAAFVIQNAFRKYLMRNRQRSPRTRNFRNMESSHGSRNQTEEKFPWKTNQNTLAMFVKPYLPLPQDQRKSPDTAVLTTDPSLFIYDRESVLVFGGVDPHSNYGVGRNTGKDVYRYLPDRNEWEFVTEMPEPRHHHQVAFLKGRVYLVGGADPRNDDTNRKSLVVGSVWSFCPVTKRWYNESNLETKRKHFGLVASDKYLFAIGGQDANGRTLHLVEKFNIATGKWTQCAPLSYPKMGVACTKFQDKIWTAGGMSGSKRNPLSSNVECYDIEKNQWTDIGRLLFPRCFSCMLSMSNRLYLIGGAGKRNQKVKTTTSLSNIDLWDEKLQEWEKLSSMTIPRHGHAVAYLGTQILIIGGVTTAYMRALSNIECFCGNRGSWVRGIQPLPTALAGHAAVTLPPARLM